jgi:hypothetical protein
VSAALTSPAPCDSRSYSAPLSSCITVAVYIRIALTRFGVSRLGAHVVLLSGF